MWQQQRRQQAERQHASLQERRRQEHAQVEDEVFASLCAITARTLLFRLYEVEQEIVREQGATLRELTYRPADRRALALQMAEGLLAEPPDPLAREGGHVLSQETLARLLLFFLDGQTVHDMAEQGIPLIVQRPEFRAYVRSRFSLPGAGAARPPAAGVPGAATAAARKALASLPLPLVQLVGGQCGTRAVAGRTRRSAGRTGGRAAGGV